MTWRPLVVVMAVAGTAFAEPANLKLLHEPAPHHLRMRPPRRAATAPSAPLPRPALAAPEPPRPIDLGAEPAQVRDLHDRVSARVNLGYVVDGTQATTADPRFSTIRAYGFGEGYLSTHGVGFDSLSSYFSGQFQLVNRNIAYDPTNRQADAEGNVVRAPPIATWFDRSGFEPRTAWIEAKDFLGQKSLAPLRLRAGEQYLYGPWVLHFYGLVAGWEGKLFRGSLYAGSYVPDYTVSDPNRELREAIGGGSVHLDLRALATPIPITVAAESVNLTSGTNQDASNHNQLELDWRPRRDLALIAQARQLAGRFVNEHVQMRARYREVTNLVLDVTHHASTDWVWDPTTIAADPASARRYLDLGPMLPQLVASARAGTLIAENIDVYARGAVAADLAKDRSRDTYSPSYLEGGGALEVRLRRTLAIGASLLSRQTPRDDPALGEILDTKDPDPLP
jgi:hypothetical protein